MPAFAGMTAWDGLWRIAAFEVGGADAWEIVGGEA
jgi:hypothetical protein